MAHPLPILTLLTARATECRSDLKIYPNVEEEDAYELCTYFEWRVGVRKEIQTTRCRIPSE